MAIPEGIKPDLLNYDDIRQMAPVFDGHPKLVEKIMHWIRLDWSNWVHRTYCYTTGVPFSNLLIDKCFRIRKRLHNEEVLDRFPDQPFIIVSNHALGALDGIMLIDMIGRHRPDYRMLVNMILSHVDAMKENFIAVDPVGSDDPEKRRITMQGIRTAMKHVRDGHPLGFFPAGAVSKLTRRLRVEDREWQPSMIRLIKQLRVPVIPVFFHETNSAFFNFLGMIDWRIRTLRLPRELFRKIGREIHVSFGEPIMPEEQDKYTDLKEFGKFLRAKDDELRAKRDW